MKELRPAQNEFELSVFGPGIGECLVVHLGNESWAVIDSCLDSSGVPIGVSYLRSLGVDVAAQVKLIVATHWHDDHIKGMASLLSEATSSQFACSMALRCEEFFALVEASDRVKLVSHQPGIKEFSDILNILDSRHEDASFAAGPDLWAMDGIVLYNDDTAGIQVSALSPSHQTVTDARASLAKLMPRSGEPMRRFRSMDAPNDLSVVVSVESEGLVALLGADLEIGATQRHGWRAILAARSANAKTAFAFKIPHHGSANAHIDEVWTQMLESPNPISAVTPYARGVKKLPGQDDLDRIRSFTDSAYCTAWPPAAAPPRRHKSVDRTADEIAKSRRAVRKTPGHVRIRRSFATSVHRVEVFDGAKLIK